ncbi:hypothetical protein [Flavobacterium sp.]|uniref:hypothetical protein n=1 Tax=Flavobacterium sp. TaxID=239 RepID=UPI0012135E97|nr:hypothetical protein [Flavobacterium sp.]RZJ69217.1 MAG: hypothetical protein EOO49_18135 [Flavobacterium sp.]
MINGRFYFRLTDSGNLVGEFSNQSSPTQSAESANRIGTTGIGFVGEYNSVWMEDDGPSNMVLVITEIPGRLFSLTWNGTNGVVFRGEGFLVDGLLIGNYWDIDLENLIPEANRRRGGALTRLNP